MNDETVAYQRATKPDWKHRVEHVLDRTYDVYYAIWDVMPAIAGVIFLIWILNTFGPQ